MFDKVIWRLWTAMLVIVFAILATRTTLAQNGVRHAVQCNGDAELLDFASGGVLVFAPSGPGEHSLYWERAGLSIETSGEGSSWDYFLAFMEAGSSVIQDGLDWVDEMVGNRPVDRGEFGSKDEAEDELQRYREPVTVVAEWYNHQGVSGGTWRVGKWDYADSGEVTLNTGTNVGKYVFNITARPDKKIGAIYIRVVCRATFSGQVARFRTAIRQRPWQSASEMMNVWRGTKLTVLGRTTDREWLKVYATRDTAGWVNADSISLPISVANLPIVGLADTPAQSNGSSASGSADLPSTGSQKQPEMRPTPPQRAPATPEEPGPPDAVPMPVPQPPVQDIPAPVTPEEPAPPAPVIPDEPPPPSQIAPEERTPEPCGDNAEFVTQSDYPTVPLGAEFSISFTVRNSGSCTWTPANGYSLTHSDGPTFGASVQIPLQATVPPGESVQFMIEMSLPDNRDDLPSWQEIAENRYRTSWFMNRNGTNFGPWMFIEITVATPANQPSQPATQDPAPDQPDYPSVVLSGGMNLGGYCQDKGFVGVKLNENTAYGWKCVAADGSLSGIDVYELCRMQFGDGYAPTFSSEADPYSWRCELQNNSGSGSNPVADLINAGKWLDFNWDGNVNIDDYAGFQEMYASCQQQPTDVCRSLDYNGDGAVNINDFDIFAGIIRG